MSVEETARTYLGLPHNAGTMKLYRNLGNGAFRDVTAEVGLDKVFMPMGSNFGDIDNDGYLDIYLGTGDPSYASLLPNVLLHNKEGKKFVDITASSGTGELHKGHGVAFADIDNDGDEDILTVIGGRDAGRQPRLPAVRKSRPWQRLDQRPAGGSEGNRSAIGARIKVTVKNEGREPRSDLPHGGQRRIVRSLAAGAAHRAGEIGRDREPGNSVAWQSEHDAALHQRAPRTRRSRSRKRAADYRKLPRKAVNWEARMPGRAMLLAAGVRLPVFRRAIGIRSPASC